MNNDSLKNEALSQMLYEAALNKTSFFQYIKPFPPLSRWARFKLWFYWRLPRLHFGPCDHTHCE